MAPLRWADGRIHRRKPFVGALALELLPGTVALIAVMIGSTSFDGFSNGTVWLQPLPAPLQPLHEPRRLAARARRSTCSRTRSGCS